MEITDKKILYVIGIVFIVAFLLFFGIRQKGTSKPPREIAEKEKVTSIEPVPQESATETLKIEVKNFDDITIEELEEKKGAKKQKEEFDLTPSIDDLIEFKKKGIKAY